MSDCSSSSLVDILSLISINYNNKVYLEKLLLICNNTEIRDYAWDDVLINDKTTSLYEIINILLIESLKLSMISLVTDNELIIWEIWNHIRSFPEYSIDKSKDSISDDLIIKLFESIKQLILSNINTIDKNILTTMTKLITNRISLIHWIYNHCTNKRIMIRQLLCEYLLYHTPANRVSEGNGRIHVNQLLKFLFCIINGFKSPLHDNNKILLIKILIPLHYPNEMIEWRDQIPILQSYHENLVNCCVELINKDRETITSNESLFVLLFKGILQSWPNTREANTGKEVLLLHELETLLSTCSNEEYIQIKSSWLNKWAKCIGECNIRIIQKALQIFKNDKIVQLCYNSANIHNEESINEFLLVMIPALFKGGELSWNPTVNKMTALALNKLKSLCDNFDELVDIILKSPYSSMIAKAKSIDLPDIINIKPIFRPPVPRTSFNSTVTSINQINKVNSIQKQQATWNSSSNQPPPLTITGVAPWAQNNSNQFTSHSAMNMSNQFQESKPSIKLSQYIKSCLPNKEDSYKELGTDWNAEQAALTPTLLPSLKFHDLVFGKELGRGAFSIVKYARVIIKDKNRSVWPEYAVKIVSASCLQEHGYYISVIREMATLQIFSHPSIARMISSFKFNQSSYMVIEYAANGDLHSYIINNGALSHQYTKFVIGEVVTAIISIHEHGFSFNDLKPENVLITSIGHVKLTDFGAVRPVTPEANQKLIESRKKLGTLRDGDWRDNIINSCNNNEIEINENEWIDNRVEGTPAYLPPEVLLHNAIPNCLSDAWSIGCLTMFCLFGKPKYYGDKQSVIDMIDVDFNIRNNNNSHSDKPNREVHFKTNESFDNHLLDMLTAIDSNVNENSYCKGFITQLLQPDPNNRMSVNQASKHDYLCIQHINNEITYIDPLSLHFKEPMNLPINSQQSNNCDDQIWSRRQFSVLWAPMPAEYNIDNSHDLSKRAKSCVDIYSMTSIQETDNDFSVPFSI